MKVAFAIGDRIELMHIKSAIGRKVSDKNMAVSCWILTGTEPPKSQCPLARGK